MPNWKKVIVSGSDAFLNTVTTTGDIIAGGNIIAQQYIVSSSVYYNTQSYSSGSTIFGDTLDDTHQFTGSFFVNGLNLNSNDYGVVIYNPATGQFFYTSSYANAGTGDNLGNHTATQLLDMSGNSIGNADLITANEFKGDLTGTSSWAENAITSSHITNAWTITDGTNGESIGTSDTVRFSGQGATAVTYNIATNTLGISTPIIGTTDEVEVTFIGAQGTQIGLPNDVTITNNLTVNNDISGSGQLFASLSLADNTVASQTVMYDTSSGKFYFTGSYGGGGGGTTLTGLDTEILFFDGDNNPSSTSTFTFTSADTFFNVGNSIVNNPGSIWSTPASEWDGNLMHAKGYPTVVNASYGVTKRIDFVGLAGNNRWDNLWPGVGRGVADGLSGAPYTYLPGYNSITGGEVTFNGPLHVANIYAEVDGQYGYTTLYINASSSGEPPQGPGGGVVIDGSVGGMVLSPDKGLLLFDTNELVKDDSGSLLTPAESASVQIKLADDNSSLSIRTGKTNLTEVLYISKSGDNPKIGIGTNDPKAIFDIKDVEDSNIGTRLLLKSSRTTTGAQIGDSAGEVIFAIDSASFNDIFTSGSVAAIDSRVRAIDVAGEGTPNVAGNIIFKSSPEWTETLNEVAEIGYFHFDNLNPSEDSEPGMTISGQLTVGSGSLWQSQAGDVAFSVYNRDSTSDNNNYLKFRVTGSNVDIPTGSLSVSKSISTEGEITTNTISTISTVIGSDSATIVDSFQGLDYQGAIYDYLLFDDGVGVRSGQFFLAQNPGTAQITFTDTSTPHLIDSVAPEISASYNASSVEVKVINGSGYTFKAFVKKL